MQARTGYTEGLQFELWPIEDNETELVDLFQLDLLSLKVLRVRPDAYLLYFTDIDWNKREREQRHQMIVTSCHH